MVLTVSNSIGSRAIWKIGARKVASCGSEQSTQRTITHCVPQGSLLRPSLSNIHTNGISEACQSTDVVLYADETEIHASSKDNTLAEH